MRAADPLVLNEHEAREMCGDFFSSSVALAEATYEHSQAQSVLVTLGGAGVQIRSSATSLYVSGIPVEHVVDTTGAGDAFVGTLAALLAVGYDLERVATGATEAAADSVTWSGARPT
jgi:ribokinase